MTLSDIQQSFYARTFNLESISNWIFGLATIVCLILLFLGIKAFIARRVRYQPHGTVTEPQVVSKIIRTAFDQRRPFEVQIATDSGERRPTLRCAPEYLGKTSLTLEINGLKSLSNKWLGRAIHVFFRVQDPKGAFTYYTFPSTIDGIFLPREGVCHITLPMPEQLENRQKRSFLRMEPPSELLMGAALWYGENMPTPEKLDDIGKWASPTLLLLPGKSRQFEIMDLSAGGVRLGIPSRVLRIEQLQFKMGEQLVMLVDLFDPEQSRRIRFWVQCRIQNVWLEHPSGDARLGMQFQAWAKPKETTEYGEYAGGIEWLRLSGSNEVEILGNWIMRRHLELFRELPQDFA